MSLYLVVVKGLHVAGVVFPRFTYSKYVCFEWVLYVGWDFRCDLRGIFVIGFSVGLKDCMVIFLATFGFCILLVMQVLTYGFCFVLCVLYVVFVFLFRFSFWCESWVLFDEMVKF